MGPPDQSKQLRKGPNQAPREGSRGAFLSPVLTPHLPLDSALMGWGSLSRITPTPTSPSRGWAAQGSLQGADTQALDMSPGGPLYVTPVINGAGGRGQTAAGLLSHLVTAPRSSRSHLAQPPGTWFLLRVRDGTGVVAEPGEEGQPEPGTEMGLGGHSAERGSLGPSPTKARRD